MVYSVAMQSPKHPFTLVIDGTTVATFAQRTTAFNAADNAAETTTAMVVVLYENGEEISRFERTPVSRLQQAHWSKQTI